MPRTDFAGVATTGRLWHVLLGAQVRAPHIGALVGTVVLAGQLGIMKTTSIAQDSRSSRSVTPLRDIRSVATETSLRTIA